MNSYPQFIQKLKDSDKELFQIAAAHHDLSMAEGSLDQKTKFLILLAADTIAGSTGVKGISERARALGASESEIKETLRIAYLVAINHIICTGIHSF